MDDHPSNDHGWADLQARLDRAASRAYADARERGSSERTARLTAERLREELLVRALKLADAQKLVESYGGQVVPPQVRSRQHGGRPLWSGAFNSPDHFVAVMREAVHAIQAEGRRPTKRAVSEWLDCQKDKPKASERTLLAKAQDCGYRKWEYLLAELQ